jgi:hypothetical protein
MDRPLPNLKRRVHLDLNQREALAEGGFEALGAIDGADSPWAALALAAGILLFFIVLLPLLGLAFELIVLLLVLWSGIVGRLVFGRPWIVEAVAVDDLVSPGRRRGASCARPRRRAARGRGGCGPPL